MGDEAAAETKADGMTNEFKGKSENLLKEMMEAFKTGISYALKNYLTLQTMYTKAFDELVQQGMKANADMITDMEGNFANLKDGIQGNFDDMNTALTSGYEGMIAKFKAECAESAKKVPNYNQAPMNECIAFLNGYLKKKQEENGKKLKTVMEQLDKKYKEIKEQVVIPVIATPKLVTPVIPSIQPATSTIMKN